jgi:hypothetical protein
VLFWRCQSPLVSEMTNQWRSRIVFKNFCFNLTWFFFLQWPFARFLGMQEPASVLFSIMNGLWHLRILTYSKSISTKVPMYYIWHIYALVGILIKRIRNIIQSKIISLRGPVLTKMAGYVYMQCIISAYNLCVVEGRRSYDHMVVTSWIYLCNLCLLPLKLWVWIPLRRVVYNTTLCDKICQWLCDRSVVFSRHSNFLHQ